MAEKIRVYQAAKRLGISEEETMRLLNVGKVITVRDSFYAPSGDDKQVTVGRTRLSYIDVAEVEALERRLKRASGAPGEKRIKPGVVRRGGKVQADAPAVVPVIQITADMAALLSLQELTGQEPPPARKFRVEIKPPLDGLKAIDVVARQVTPEWKKDPKSEEDLSKMLRAIAFGACGILAQQKATAPKKEPNPLGERDAYMRDEITVKIQTKISETVRKIVSDVINGRRGYSNVLRESVAVRAHFARYHTGKGRGTVTPILRAAHRRGGPGDKERTYKVRS